MIDATTAAILQAIVRREGQSLIHYVSEAFPWTNPEEQSSLVELRKIIDEELRSAGRLGSFLYRQRIPLPYIGSYPASFTNINYVALDHLLPLLVDQQRRAISDLESDLARLKDSEAQAQVQQVLDIKRRHQKTLTELAAKHSRPAVVASVK